MNAETLMFLGGIAVFSLTIYWVRSRDLSEKHAILWTILAFILLVCGLFPNLIMSFANRSHLSYAAAVLFMALAAIYIYSFSVSVSLTWHQRRNTRLTQEIALLESRVERLEQIFLESQNQTGVDATGRDERANIVPQTPPVIPRS